MPKNNGKARKAWRKALADTRVKFWVEFDKRYPLVPVHALYESADALDTHLALRSPRP